MILEGNIQNLTGIFLIAPDGKIILADSHNYHHGSIALEIPELKDAIIDYFKEFDIERYNIYKKYGEEVIRSASAAGSDLIYIPVGLKGYVRAGFINRGKRWYVIPTKGHATLDSLYTIQEIENYYGGKTIPLYIAKKDLNDKEVEVSDSYPVARLVSDFGSKNENFNGDFKMKTKMRVSKLRQIIKEEIRRIILKEDRTLAQVKALAREKTPRGYNDITKDFGKITTKQDLGVKRYTDRVEPELKRRIEAMKAVLSMLKPGSESHRVVKGILDSAENEMRMPTDRQMDLISQLYLKSVSKIEAAAGMSGMETTWASNKPTDFTYPAPNDEKR